MPNIQLDADSNTNEPYLEFYQHLMTLENEEIAQVISISYADAEQVKMRHPDLECSSFPLPSDVNQICLGIE